MPLAWRGAAGEGRAFCLLALPAAGLLGRGGAGWALTDALLRLACELHVAAGGPRSVMSVSASMESAMCMSGGSGQSHQPSPQLPALLHCTTRDGGIPHPPPSPPTPALFYPHACNACQRTCLLVAGGEWIEGAPGPEGWNSGGHAWQEGLQSATDSRPGAINQRNSPKTVFGAPRVREAQPGAKHPQNSPLTALWKAAQILTAGGGLLVASEMRPGPPW